MNLFNLTPYEIDDTIYYTPSFVQIYNKQTKKREILVNKDWLDFWLAYNDDIINIYSQLSTLNSQQNNYYVKIQTPTNTDFMILYQQNNQLYLSNATTTDEIFYRKSTIDTFLLNLQNYFDSQISLKLTQPINSSGSPKIIQIDENQIVSLINSTGLNYISENTTSKTLSLNVTDVTGVIEFFINSISKLKITNTAINPTTIIDFISIPPQIWYNGNRKFYISGNDSFFWNSSLRLCNLTNANTQTNYFFIVSETVMSIYG